MITVVADNGARWSRAALATPLGPLTVVYAGTAVVAATFDEDPGPYWFGREVEPAQAPSWLERLVETALCASLGPVAWSLVDPGLSALEARALSEATAIPFGETRAYGEVARSMGYPGRARLVGRAMSRSPASLLIPTHRVIRADGRPACPERTGMPERLRAYERRVTQTESTGRDRGRG